MDPEREDVFVVDLGVKDVAQVDLLHLEQENIGRVQFVVVLLLQDDVRGFLQVRRELLVLQEERDHLVADEDGDEEEGHQEDVADYDARQVEGVVVLVVPHL